MFDWLAGHFAHMPQLAATWVVFFGAGWCVYFGHALRDKLDFSFKSFLQVCMPLHIIKSKSCHLDVKMWVVSRATSSIVFAPALLLNAFVCSIVSDSLQSLWPTWAPLEFNVLCASAGLVAIFVVADFCDFLSHYVQHKVPFLWELHKVHHTAESLNPLTAKREHPLAVAIEAAARGLLTAVPSGIFAFAFGIASTECVALYLISQKVLSVATLDPLRHSHYAVSFGVLDRILISPHMHQIHHSKSSEHLDKNFGTNLSIFDWLFGTAYKPARHETPLYGITEHTDTVEDESTLYAAYIHPLVRMYRIGSAWLPKIRPSRQIAQSSVRSGWMA